MEILDDVVDKEIWKFGEYPFKVFAIKLRDGSEGRMYIGETSEALLKNVRILWKKYVVWYKRLY